MRSIGELNQLDPGAFATEMAPLFEGAPKFLAALAAARPFDSDEDLFDSARVVARELSADAQLELLGAHPRIGADPVAISSHSRQEQGYDGQDPLPDDQAWVGNELEALNDAYETRFGFRFVVFVDGRPKSEILEILQQRLERTREEELQAGLRELVAIARDRWEGG